MLALGACTGKNAPADEDTPVSSASLEEQHPFADNPYYYLVEQYDIDLLSEEGQPMSEERASVHTLIDVFYN